MKRSAHRRPTALVMLFALLWMQLAVAAYACPSLLPAMSTYATTMPDCDAMARTPFAGDLDNPNLCLQHSLQGDQHSDAGSASGVPPPGDVLLAVVARDVSPPLATLRTALDRGLWRAASPPKSIAHCCLRI